MGGCCAKNKQTNKPKVLAKRRRERILNYHGNAGITSVRLASGRLYLKAVYTCVFQTRS